MERDGIPPASFPRRCSGQAGQARTWSSGFLSEGSIVSLQNLLPFCELCDIMCSLGDHNKIPQKGCNEGCYLGNLPKATAGVG